MRAGGKCLQHKVALALVEQHDNRNMGPDRPKLATDVEALEGLVIQIHAEDYDSILLACRARENFSGAATGLSDVERSLASQCLDEQLAVHSRGICDENADARF